MTFFSIFLTSHFSAFSSLFFSGQVVVALLGFSTFSTPLKINRLFSSVRDEHWSWKDWISHLSLIEKKTFELYWSFNSSFWLNDGRTATSVIARPVRSLRERGKVSVRRLFSKFLLLQRASSESMANSQSNLCADKSMSEWQSRPILCGHAGHQTGRNCAPWASAGRWTFASYAARVCWLLQGEFTDFYATTHIFVYSWDEIYMHAKHYRAQWMNELNCSG